MSIWQKVIGILNMNIFITFLLEKLDHFSHGGPIWVTVEGPYGSIGGPMQ